MRSAAVERHLEPLRERCAEDDLADRPLLVVHEAELRTQPRLVERGRPEQADLLLPREQQLDAGMTDVLDENAPQALEHLRHRRLVVGAEDRAAGIPDHAVLDDGAQLTRGRHRVEVGAEEERRTFRRRLDPRVDVAERILLGLETETAQITQDDVGDGVLLTRRRGQGSELEEEVDHVGHAPILGGGLGRDVLAGSRAGAVERSADEAAEQRRRPRRPRLELRVELARDEPGMVGQLDDLDEPALLERPADHEASSRRAGRGTCCSPRSDAGAARGSSSRRTTPACASPRRPRPPARRAASSRRDPRSPSAPADRSMTGYGVSGSISVEFAPSNPTTWRANSDTATCMPRQIPRYGMPRSRATWHARILPSQPREPNPPGTSTPSTFSSSSAVSS